MADQILLVGHLFDAAPLAWGLLPLMFRVTPTRVGYSIHPLYQKQKNSAKKILDFWIFGKFLQMLGIVI